MSIKNSHCLVYWPNEHTFSVISILSIHVKENDKLVENKKYNITFGKQEYEGIIKAFGDKAYCNELLKTITDEETANENQNEKPKKSNSCKANFDSPKTPKTKSSISVLRNAQNEKSKTPSKVSSTFKKSQNIDSSVFTQENSVFTHDVFTQNDYLSEKKEINKSSDVDYESLLENKNLQIENLKNELKFERDRNFKFEQAFKPSDIQKLLSLSKYFINLFGTSNDIFDLNVRKNINSNERRVPLNQKFPNVLVNPATSLEINSLLSDKSKEATYIFRKIIGNLISEPETWAIRTGDKILSEFENEVLCAYGKF